MKQSDDVRTKATGFKAWRQHFKEQLKQDCHDFHHGFEHRMNFDTFHKSHFSTRGIVEMMIALIVLFIAMYLYIKMTALKHGTGNSSVMFLGFLLMELVPVFVIMLFFGDRGQFGSLFPNFFSHSWKEIKRWTKYLALDAWHHKLMILLFVFLMIVEQNLFNKWLPDLFGQGMQLSGNTTAEKSVMMSDKLFAFAIIIIAPVTEELFFRQWLTTLIARGFYNMWSQHVPNLCYWVLGALPSAFLFATMHDGVSNPYLLTGYIGLALILQGITKRTGSVTASIVVHSSYNFVGLLPVLLA